MNPKKDQAVAELREFPCNPAGKTGAYVLHDPVEDPTDVFTCHNAGCGARWQWLRGEMQPSGIGESSTEAIIRDKL